MALRSAALTATPGRSRGDSRPSPNGHIVVRDYGLGTIAQGRLTD
jgi:hypothetical protein